MKRVWTGALIATMGLGASGLGCASELESVGAALRARETAGVSGEASASESSARSSATVDAHREPEVSRPGLRI